MTERDDIRLTDASATDDPGAIRAEIEDTRERLGDTLEQLGDRLNPRNIAAQVKDSVRGATLGKAQAAARDAAGRVGEASEPVMAKARQYPLPAVALAAGLGWLLAGRGRGSSTPDIAEGMSESGKARSSDAGYTTSPDPIATPPVYASAPLSAASATSSASSASSASDSSSTLSTARMGSVPSDLGSLNRRGSIDDWNPAGTTTAYDEREEQGTSAKGRVKEVGGAVAAQTRDLPRRISDRARANPVQMGVATLAAGLAAGFAVPVTNREVELMGDQRDQLVDRVRGAVQQTRDRAKQAAGEVVQQTKTAASQALHGQGPTA